MRLVPVVSASHVKKPSSLHLNPSSPYKSLRLLVPIISHKVVASVSFVLLIALRT